MACKLRKVIGAMKDQTSIGLAMIRGSANLEVNILKATTHDEIPMDNRYVYEIVLLVSSNKVYAEACAQFIGKRVGRTRNWVVSLKSLMLVFRIFQDGDPFFPREIFHAMKKGSKIINLSNFKDGSTSSSWDYSCFIRTFALYLQERLDCFLTGKLQRRLTIQKKNLTQSKTSRELGIKGMKPTLVLDRITHWQKLLDRAIETSPIGAAQNNGLIKVSVYAIVKESFDLYRDISDGLSVILDNFYHLPHKACVIAYEACVKSSTQFDELSRFYALCTSLGIGGKFEYPCVQKVASELVETLQEFLRDKASFSTNNVQLLSPLCDSKHNLLPPLPKDTGLISSHHEAYEQHGPPSKSSEKVEKHDSQVKYQEQKDTNLTSNHGSTESWDSLLDEIASKPKQGEQHDSQTRDQEQKNTTSRSNNGSIDCWDLVLAEISSSAPKQASQHVTRTQYNPFLENTANMAPNFVDPAPTFHGSVPMVIAQNPLQVAIAPTFTGQCYYNYQTCYAHTLGDLNGMKISPTFTPQVNFWTRMVAEPTLHAPSLNTITYTEPAFHIPGSYNEAATDLALSRRNHGLRQ